MKKIKIIGLALLLTALYHTSEAGDTPVLSLTGNGILTWTNSFTNALFTVQWASSLGGSPTNTVWMEDWTSLENFSARTGVTSVAVPMFYRVRCQPATVRLGDAFFDDTSARVPTNSYLYFPALGNFNTAPPVTNWYNGYGNYAGEAYTQVYVFGEIDNQVSGVSCIVVHKSGNVDITPADYWVATDILDNVRLLQVVEYSNVVYAASITNTPPMMLPCNVMVGQTWNRLGAWLTVINTNATYQSYSNLLEIQWVSSFDVDHEYYQLGLGQVFDHWYDSPTPSGFQLRTW